MADQSDVEAALVAAIGAALKQGGGVGPVRVYRGWPVSAGLAADMAAGVANISVYPTAEPIRYLPPFPGEWALEERAPTLVAHVHRDTVVFSGEPCAGDVVGLVVDGVGIRYAVVPGDTARDVAGGIAAALRAGRPAYRLNARVLVPGAVTVRAHVVRNAVVVRELRRQEQQFRLALWCPSPMVRDTLAAAVDGSLASVRFLPVVDGSFARITRCGGSTIDQGSEAELYRRDLVYSLEYATTEVTPLPRMVLGSLDVNAAERDL